MNNKVRQYLELPYSTYVVPDETTENEPCYLAYHPELPGCMSHGSTPEEAVQNLLEATELCISTLLDMGLDIPTPMSTEVRMEITLAPSLQPSFAESNLYTLPSISAPIFSSVP